MSFARRPGTFVLASVAVLGMTAAPSFLCARHQENEQELVANIERENNPTRKAKLEIQLGTLKLEQAATAFDHDEFDGGAKLLDQYSGWMGKAWGSLEETGRDASRKAQGFKDLDIALRENARALADLAHRTPFSDRGAIEQTAKLADALHTQVLAALFPSGVKEQVPAPDMMGARMPVPVRRGGEPQR